MMMMMMFLVAAFISQTRKTTTTRSHYHYCHWLLLTTLLFSLQISLGSATIKEGSNGNGNGNGNDHTSNDYDSMHDSVIDANDNANDNANANDNDNDNDNTSSNNSASISIQDTKNANNKNSMDDICIDRDPNCKDWALHAECRMLSSFEYMQANCPGSCSLCNPAFEHWKPLDMHAGEQSKSILTQQYANDRIPIYHGVTQITNFTNNSGFADYPIRTFDSENKSGIIAAEEYYTWRINDAVEAMNVYLDLIYADEVTYVDRNGKVARDDNPYSTIKQFSPVDVDAAPIGAQLPLPELCVNRHPNCALWSVIGQCDGSVQLMSRQCSAMCQNCDTNLVRPDGIYFEQNLWIQSPFQRDDLMGVFESIMQDRIVVYVQYRKEHFPNNMKVESRKSNSHLNYLNFEEIPVDPIIVRRNHKDEEIYRKALKSNGSGPRVATMLRLNKFLSKEDCQGLLDKIFIFTC